MRCDRPRPLGLDLDHIRYSRPAGVSCTCYGFLHTEAQDLNSSAYGVSNTRNFVSHFALPVPVICWCSKLRQSLSRSTVWRFLWHWYPPVLSPGLWRHLRTPRPLSCVASAGIENHWAVGPDGGVGNLGIWQITSYLVDILVALSDDWNRSRYVPVYLDRWSCIRVHLFYAFNESVAEAMALQYVKEVCVRYFIKRFFKVQR